MEYDVISIGDPVIDFVQIREESGLVYKAFSGGGAANVLAEVCAMGGTAMLLGSVGKDIFGDYLIQEIRSRGVESSAIARIDAKHTGIGFVALAQNGERSFLNYRDYETPVELWNEKWDQAIRQCRIFHFTSVSLVNSRSREETLRAVRQALEYGKLVSFDVNYRSDMWPDVQFAKDLFRRCIGLSHIIKISEEEKVFLTGDLSNTESAKRICGDKEKIVLISLGANGSYFFYQGGEGECRPYPVLAKDTTGCGDAFIGTMLANLSQWRDSDSIFSIPRDNIIKMVLLANAAGAVCAGKFGSFSAMPYRWEAEKLMMERKE